MRELGFVLNAAGRSKNYLQRLRGPASTARVGGIQEPCGEAHKRDSTCNSACKSWYRGDTGRCEGDLGSGEKPGKADKRLVYVRLVAKMLTQLKSTNYNHGRYTPYFTNYILICLYIVNLLYATWRWILTGNTCKIFAKVHYQEWLCVDIRKNS